MGGLIGIYDNDTSFGDNFSGYINQREAGGMTCVAFGSLEYLKNFQKRRPLDILLISEDIILEKGDQICEGKIYILTDAGSGSTGGPTRISKYQSVERILEIIHEGGLTPGDFTGGRASGRPVTIIGVFSPVGRCLKTSFALTLGQLLAREERVLYINLEEYGFFPGLEKNQAGISDLFYDFLKAEQSHNDFSRYISSAGSLDYIAPAVCPEDLMDVSSEDAARLISEAGNAGQYESIIIDIGSGGRNPGPLFDICRKIYMPVREDCVSKGKIAAFEGYLNKTFRGDILLKTEYLVLPELPDFRPGEDYIGALVWSGLGDYVRALLEGGC